MLSINITELVKKLPQQNSCSFSLALMGISLYFDKIGSCFKNVEGLMGIRLGPGSSADPGLLACRIWLGGRAGERE